MEATALSLGKAVLNGALDYAKSMVAEEIALQLGIEGDVVFIGDELEMMQSFLMSADEEQDKHPVLLTWVKQVREVAYNVEDSLMDFSVHSDKRPSCWWCIPCSLWERRNIAKEVKELRVKVEDVSNRNLRYRLIKGAGSKPTTAAEEQASIATATMSGINLAMRTAMVQENSKVDLCQLIRDGDKDLRVITVCGESSDDSGMISAIQEVYQDPNVNASFGFRAWVTLMHPFDPAEFIWSLVRQFYVNFPEELEDAHKRKTAGASVYMKMESMTQTAITDVFDTQVVDNSYLIVIEDLSTIMEWDCIKMYFPNNKKGSRIIVSTRQFKIARVCAEKPFQISELEEQLPSHPTLYILHKEVECTSKSSGLSSAENSAISSGEIQEEEQQAKDAGGDDKASDSGAGKKFGRSKTMALVDEVLLGRSKEKSELIALIGQPEDNLGLKVISVWGMGGIGKTTLAQSVYRSPELGRWKRAWATALRPFNPESVIRKLGVDLLGSSKMELKELTEKLSTFLKGEKCLIVLDDISSVAEWDMVNSCLEHTTRIIVTTREKFIAKHCSKEDKNMYNVSSLEEKVEFDLFIKKVSKDGAEKINLSPHMVEQARLILKKCDRLPLAISTIGGYLANKPKTATEWRKTYDHISRELEINPELRTIKTVLVRSYDGLPYHLKSCFLYLSIFPEDLKIWRKPIVRRWVAEGYAREMHGMTAEEVGDNYFEELLDRSMVLPGDDVNICSGKIEFCQLHDIMRQICIAKAREENLCFTLEDGGNLSSRRDAIRHLFISSKWKRDEDMFKSVLDLSHLRSLTVFGDLRPFIISKKMRFLRVLDLKQVYEEDHLDQIIPQLIHLRYLSVMAFVIERISVVPWLVPPSFANLRKLQFLCGGSGFTFTGGIEKLSALRTLDYVEVEDTLPALRQLHQLRELGIDGIRQTNSEEFWSAISSLKHLRSLSVNWRNLDEVSADQVVDYCLGRRLSPPRSIESLKLKSKLVTVTEWIHQLQNLSKLQLCGAELKQDAIQAVGKLPGLVILTMRESFNGEELIFEQGSFPSLMQLELRYTLDIQIVKFEDGTMPKLELLRIYGSKKLRPELRGLRCLPNLKEIQLNLGYSSKEFKDNIEEFKVNIEEQLAQHHNKVSVTCLP